MLDSVPYNELDLEEIEGIRQHQQAFYLEKLDELIQLANQLHGKIFKALVKLNGKENLLSEIGIFKKISNFL